MNKKVLLAVWIASISAVQFSIDKLIFPESEKIQRRELELYRPVAEAQSKIDHSFEVIRNKGYINRLDPNSRTRHITPEYIQTTLDFHHEVLQVFDAAGGQDLYLAIREMASAIGVITQEMGNQSCVAAPIEKDFLTATTEYLPTLERISLTGSKIRDFDARVMAAKPSHNEKGELDVQAEAEKILLIGELASKPYLFVNQKLSEDPLTDIPKLLGYYRTIHLGYIQCLEVYAVASKNNEDDKLIWQVLSFLLLTVLLYWKDLL